MDNILGQKEEDKMLAQVERDPYLRYDQGPAPTQQQLQQSALELQQMHSRNDFQVLFDNGSQELEEKMPDGQNSRPTPQQSAEEMQRAAYFAHRQQQQLQLQRYQAQQAQQHQAQYSHQPLPQQLQGNRPQVLSNDSQQLQNSQQFPHMVQQAQQNGANAQLQTSPPLQYGAYHQQLLQQPVCLQQGQQFRPPPQLGPQPGYEQLLYNQHSSQHGLVSHPQPHQQPVMQKAYEMDQYLERKNSAMISAGVPVHMPQATQNNAMSLQQYINGLQQAAYRGLVALPEEVLAMIMHQMHPMDFLNCRRVSKIMASRLSSNQLCREYLRAKFPLSKWGARWIKYLSYKDALVDAKRAGVPLPADVRAEMNLEGVTLHLQDWSKLLLDTLRRQLGFETATYSRRFTYLSDISKGSNFAPMVPWGLPSYIQYHDRYADASWGFEDGILVYYRSEVQQYVATVVSISNQVFVTVPFSIKGRIIRRVRLCQGVLAFEWAEGNATFMPPGEHVHIHRITLFDLCLTQKLGPLQDKVRIDGLRLRFEWNIRPEGYTIATEGGDTFFTAHNKTHYAVYACIRGRGKDRRTNTVTETVTVWDIQKTAEQTSPTIAQNLDTGTRIIKDVRKASQGGHPQFLGLFISKNTVGPNGSTTGYVFFHLEHRSGDSKYHSVESVGLPLEDNVEVWYDHCLPGCNHDSYGLDDEELADARDSDASESGWPGRAPHWRHHGPPLERDMEIARMHNSSAQVSMVVKYKKTVKALHVGVSAPETFGMTREPHFNHYDEPPYFDNRPFYRRYYADRKNRCNIYGLIGTHRFLLLGDETMLVCEAYWGDIEVWIL